MPFALFESNRVPLFLKDAKEDDNPIFRNAELE
jgi:hypothetical protein